jgi:hypothetical protein
MHDLILLLIYRVPALAFGILVVLTLALPAIHLLLVAGRVISGRSAQVNWWVVWRVLPLVIAVIVAVPLGMMAQTWTSDWQLTLAEVALVYLCVAVIFLPVALPLVQAYVSGMPRFGAFAYALLAILSLPVAAATATQASAVVTQGIIAAASDDPYAPPRATGFLIDSTVSRCSDAWFRTIPEGWVNELPAADEPFEVSYPPYFFFWADMSLKAAFLDFFEVFACNVTNLRHNPDHVLLSSFVFLYRAFVSVIVLAVLALPFGRRAA